MYDVIKEVINSGDYELVDMLSKIDKLWVEGKLSNEQRDELTKLAESKADPDQTLPDLTARITALELRVKALEDAGSDPSPGPETPSEWVQPTGAHDAYAKGAKVLHNGKTWASNVDNNVWEPGVYGWTESN